MAHKKQMPYSPPDSNPKAFLPDHLLGAGGSGVLLVEYGDYECPACSEAEPVTRLLLATYGDRLTFAYRHFPLSQIHPHAEQAAEAAEAASAQGKFWEMHQLLFTHWQHLSAAMSAHCAQTLGLDMPRFNAEMAERRYRQRVMDQRASGERLGVRASPAFFLSGVIVDVSFGLEHLEATVRLALERS
ncbi:protein-disulfide isomerase [Variovorax sp. GrIS 2.14]|jgi:protein-disulfide isomerase|nr:thioredoxin domain-containing protein [Variovorax sp. RTB1]